MRTDELIVQLAGATRPVPPLRPPFTRLTRWMVVALPITALAVLIRPRADLATALLAAEFSVRAVVTLATALLAAGSAFVLSVPGAERSPLQRALPFLTAGVWISFLAALLVNGGNPVSRLAALPVHLGCIYLIAGLSVVPAMLLIVMLRQAAPLRPGWIALLAAIAAVGIGAAATQAICPLDDPAHQLVGHVLPFAVITALAALAGRRPLDWSADLVRGVRL